MLHVQAIFASCISNIIPIPVLSVVCHVYILLRDQRTLAGISEKQELPKKDNTILP